MQHPSEKFIKIELASIVLAVFIFLFAIIQGYILGLFMALYFIAISIFCEGMVAFYMNNRISAAKQITRSLLLFFLTTFIFFRI